MGDDRFADEVVFELDMYVTKGGEEKKELLLKVCRPEHGVGGEFVGKSMLLLDGEIVFEQYGEGVDSFQAMYEVMHLSKVVLYKFLEDKKYQFYFLNEMDGSFYTHVSLDTLFSKVF